MIAPLIFSSVLLPNGSESPCCLPSMYSRNRLAAASITTATMCGLPSFTEESDRAVVSSIQSLFEIAARAVSFPSSTVKNK